MNAACKRWLARSMAAGSLVYCWAAAAADEGPALYGLVQAYSAFGDHRSGTPADAATRDWFAAELRRRGGKVERQPFTFARDDAQGQVRIDGRVVPSLPLFYEGAGEITDDRPAIATVPAMEADRPSAALVEAIAAAKAAGARTLIVATTHPSGELQVPNRAPQQGGDMPVVLVPGREADALRAASAAGRVQVRYQGRRVEGRSENIVARFGDTAARAPLVIATPLSCWFRCAAERGSGVALALALAEHMAPKIPVVVVGTPGHELLPHVGLQALFERNAFTPALVMHLGANVVLGARDAQGTLLPAAGRGIGARMAPEVYARVAPWLARLGVTPQRDPARWYGEGALWVQATAAPLVSFVGAGTVFHTPADTPEATLSPVLMGAAYDALAGALDAWLDPAAPPPTDAPAAGTPAAPASAAAPQAAASSPALAVLASLRPRVEPYTAAQIDAVSGRSGLTDCFWVGTVNRETFNILYPDDGVTYWATQVQLPAGARLSLEGRYPHARHISFNTYDASGAPLDRLNDVLIEPRDAGAPNPYRAGASRTSAERDYRVDVAERELVAGRPVDDATRAPSTLYRSAADGNLQIVYRIYVPDAGRGPKGGEPLPKPVLTLAGGHRLEGEALCRAVVRKDGAVRDVSVPVDALRRALALPNRAPYAPAQPQPRWNAFFNPMLGISSLLIGTPYESVRASLDATRRGGFYGTLDNIYLSLYIDARYGDALVLQGRAPRTPRTQAGQPTMEGDADLRYWSVCKYRSLADTAVDACVYDEQVPRDTDGRYTLVVSKPEQRPSNARAECGVAWLPWGLGDNMGNPNGGFLLLRQMMPSAAFRPTSAFATRKPGDERETLGPYYPEPSYASRAAFEARGCPVAR